MIKFYNKKMGEFQFKYSAYTRNGKTSGGIFVDCGNIEQGSNGEKIDWDNKICVKLGEQDITKILFALRMDSPKVSLTHRSEKDGVVKQQFINIKEGKDGSISLEISNGENKVYSYLNLEDQLRLQTFLDESLRRLMFLDS